MKDTQAMKKAMRTTMRKVLTIFERQKSNNPDSVASRSSEIENCGTVLVKDELKASQHFSQNNSTESSPEPLDVTSSSEEDNAFDKGLSTAQNNRTFTSKESVLETIECKGANGFVDTSASSGRLALVPINDETSVVLEEVCVNEVLTSCGDFEKQCSNLPYVLQEKILKIKENIFWHFPPFYDFCLIASDDDYEEAEQFKKYVSKSFGLTGCTLHDGFMHLGAELFECYEMMMDHSSKVFFFVTENFTSSAFCKRLQSGAVFQSLMSKAKKDREKCVPVFPHGLQQGIKIPLALSGIAGLNPTQYGIMQCSLRNTYSPQMRYHRYVRDQENFKKRCLEFKREAITCIEQYQKNELESEVSVLSLSENTPAVAIEHCKANGLPEISSPQPAAIQMPENCDHKVNGSGSSDSIDLSRDVSKTELRGPEKISGEDQFLQKDSNDKEYLTSEKREACFVDSDKATPQSMEDDTSRKSEQEDCDLSDDDIWKTLPDNIREILNLTVPSGPSVSARDCENVHVGPVINVTINHVASPASSHIQQND